MDEKKTRSARTAIVATTAPQASAGAPPFQVEQSAAAAGSRRRPAPLSYEEVAQSADAIEAAGEKVTIARIRQQVGGAAETVTSFLGRWREARRTVRTSGDGLSDTLKVALLREFSAEREAARAEMQEQLAEQREVAAELDAELRRTRDTIAAHEQVTAAMHSELAQANEKIAAGEHAVALMREKSAAEVETLTGQHQDLQGQLARLREELGQMRCRAEVEAGRAKTLDAENGRLRTELVQAGRKVEDATQKVAVAEQRAAVAMTKLDGQAELLSMAREQTLQDRRRISELTQEARTSHERAGATEETQEKLRHKLGAAHARAGEAPPSPSYASTDKDKKS